MTTIPAALKSMVSEPQIHWTPSCASTSSSLKALAAQEVLPAGYVLAAVAQTAGRGQRGNSWEAEPGKNLTFSILLRPQGIAAAAQFELSMLVSLAITDTIRSHCGVETLIKWPNDIYTPDGRKICGILIENSLSGAEISTSVAGIGLNVNQTEFLSDAPNPVSLRQLLGHDTPLEPLLEELSTRILRYLSDYASAADPRALLGRYKCQLWRGDGGLHPFRIPGGENFMAAIEDVRPSGELILRDSSGARRAFLFKEVEFILSPQHNTSHQ